MTTRVSSFYGPRDLFGRSFHHGIDYSTPIGAPIYANKELTVTYAGSQNGYGNVVYARDNMGTEYRFGHLDSIPPETKVGSTLTPGTKIAYTGNTGDSTGAHLHYEVRRGGKSVDPLTTIDPSTGKPYENNATFEPGGSSMRNSTAKIEPGYTPKGTLEAPKTRSLNPAKPVTRPDENQSPAESARLGGYAKPQRPPGIKIPRINPLLRLGDR